MCPLPSNAPEETQDSQWGLAFYNETFKGPTEITGVCIPQRIITIRF